MPRQTFRLVLLLATAVSFLDTGQAQSIVTGPSRGTAESSHSDDVKAPVLPQRRPAQSSSLAPLNLPPGGDRVAPSVMDVTITRRHRKGQAQVLRQTITRSADRVHIARHEGPEWLFQRNTVDTRRVSGYLIDHVSETVVFHSESDLRLVMGIPGWAHVLTLGFDSSLVAQLTRSSRSRTIGGVRFVQLSTPGRGESSHVWWSDEQALPAAFRTSDDNSETGLAIEAIRPVRDPSVLQHPEARFPNYRKVELADWLEQH